MRGSLASTVAFVAGRWGCASLLLLAVPALSAIPAHGLVSFDEAQLVDPSQGMAGESDNDGGITVAGDGTGIWIAAWHSFSAPAVGQIVYSRSTDNGATWSVPSVLDPGPGDRPDLATDGAGVWIAAWSDSGLARSIDNGISWSGVPMPPSYRGDGHTLATDGSGAWVLVWHSTETLGATIGIDHDILVARSVDNGLTWTAPAALNTDAASDDPSPSSVNDDRNPSLSTDGAGMWIAVWQEENGPDEAIVSATSSDNGATWSSPVAVGSGGTGGGEPDVETDDAGLWVVVWDGSRLADTGQDFDILFSRSTDAGASWSGAATLNATAASDTADLISDGGARIATDADGNWYCLWTSANGLNAGLGDDLDVLVARSTDAASTWTFPSALDPDARGDSGSDRVTSVAFDGNGNWLAAWSTFDVSTNDIDVRVAASQDHCPSVPVVGCLSPAIPGRGRVMIRNRHDGRSKIKWKWIAGEETTLADLGDPSSSSDYVLCLYDEIGGQPRLDLEQDLLAATGCKNGPCWQATSSGFKYKDRSRRHNATDSARLKAAEAQKAKVKVRAVGPTLGPPNLPLSQATTVRVQLNNLETGACWETVHTTSTRNDSEYFKARSD